MSEYADALAEWNARKARHVCPLCRRETWWIPGEKRLCSKTGCGDAYLVPVESADVA